MGRATRPMHPAVRNWINQRTTNFSDPQNRAARHYGFRERMGELEENRLYNFFKGKGTVPKSLKRLNGFIKASKGLRPGLLAPVTSFMSSFVPKEDVDTYRRRKTSEYYLTRGGKRPMIDPNQPPTSGNKRPGGAPAGGAAYKRPRPAPTDADDTLPVEPYQPDWPGDDPMDDPDDDDPKGGRGGGGRADWSGNPGTMRRHAAPVSMGTSMKRGKSGPAGMGYSMKQVSDTCTRITGRAYVGEVNSQSKLGTGQVNGATPKANALGLIFDINPSLLNDRVAVISSTFQKYVYQSVRFTYVPQCSTAVSGSIGLVFDRDPLMISANTQGSQFLSEVMSYEHATLTPAYVGASASYTRDPKELKTWFLGAPDATTSTRETSQGNLLCYMSNVERDKGYGFIVMDYVLDLIAPTLLPAKQGIIDIKKAPSQWADCSLAAVSQPIRESTFDTRIGGTDYYAYFNPPAWQTNFTGDVAGAVGEIQLGGFTQDGVAAGNFAPNSAVGALIVTAEGPSAGGAGALFAFGQKLYFCVHTITTTNGAKATAWSWHTTLSSARSAAGQASSGKVGVNSARIVPDQLLITCGGTDAVNVGGWARLINEGCGSEDTA